MTSPRLLLPLLLNFLCQAGYVNGNPSGSLLENRSKNAYLEEWIFTGDDSSDEQRVTNFPVLLHSTGNTDYIRDDDPRTPRPSRQPDSLPWEPTRLQVSCRTDQFTAWVKMDPHDVLKLPQTFARHQKGGLLHLLRQTMSANIYLIVHPCRSGSASTTGTQGTYAEKKMPPKSTLQAGGMSLPCRRHL